MNEPETMIEAPEEPLPDCPACGWHEVTVMGGRCALGWAAECAACEMRWSSAGTHAEADRIYRESRAQQKAEARKKDAPGPVGRKPTTGRYASRAELERAIVQRDRHTESSVSQIAAAVKVSAPIVRSVIKAWDGHELRSA